MKFWFLILMGAVLEVAGDYLLKKQSFVWGLLVYFIGSCFWALSLRETEISRAIVLFTVVNILLVVGMGIISFDEVLTTRQMLGVAFALASVVLI